MNLKDLDDMRHALAVCSFPPGTATKRFGQTICNVPIESLTERQRSHIVRLCWRYRRQIPWHLVPSKDAIDALDSKWQLVTVAGVEVMTSTKDRALAKPKKAAFPLFDAGSAP